MARYRRGQIAAATLVGALVIAAIGACGDSLKSYFRGAPVVVLPASNTFQRVAQGGGHVTVDVTVVPGPLPGWNTPPASPEIIAWFSNRGEMNKHEKRYDWKPRHDAVYQLVLSSDPPSVRTKWTMYEVTGAKTRTPFRSGHLWQCDDDHSSPGRDVSFKDCLGRSIPYDPRETAFQLPAGSVIFASYLMPEDEGLSLEDAAAWISCTSGCCSLGT